MTPIKSFLLLCGLLLGLLAGPAHAECGGQTQCIGVGATAAAAAAGHHGGTATFTLTYGNQALATPSASQTVFVAAVTGAGTATLGALTITGANANQFLITGGTCPAGGGAGPVHGGANCTITVAFNPSSVGAKSATLNVPLAPPCGGCITGRTVSLAGTGGTLPVGSATTLSVAANTPTMLNLASLISGTAPLTVSITAAAASGTATLAGTVVTYTPNNNFLGADTLSYQVTNSGGVSAAVAVTVSVVPRVSPAADAAVVGTINAHTQTLQRFALTQTANFMQRMESLRGGAVAQNAAGRSAGLLPGGATPLGQGLRAPAGSLTPAQGSRPGDVAALPGALPGAFSESLSGASLPDGSTTPPGNEQAAMAAMAGALSGLIGSGRLNLSGLDTGMAAAAGQRGSTGLWVGGSASFGGRGQTAASSALRFGTDGISVGFDHRFDQRLALGMGLGYARSRTSIGTDSSHTKSTGVSLAVYSSFHPTPSTFIDGMLGYGASRHDSARFVAAANDTARASRNGEQIFGSVAAGYEHRQDNLLVSPYGRLDFSLDRLMQATETGAGLNALRYLEQKSRTLQMSLGVRAESVHRTSFGWIAPKLRIEAKHDFTGPGSATVLHADQLSGPQYVMTSPVERRNSLLLGLGGDFIYAGGWRLGLDYQVQRSFGPERNQAIRVWLSKELDGKGPTLPSGFTTADKMFTDPVRVDVGYLWEANLTRARADGSIRADSVYSVQAGKTRIFPLTTHTRLIVTGQLEADKLRVYSGLDRVAAGLEAEYQYRTSGEFDATTFGLFARATLEDYNSRLRGGVRSSIGITARRTLTDRIQLFGALAHNQRHAKHEVFDARDYSARFSADYSIGAAGVIYIGGEYRRGDAVSTGRRTPENLSIASASVADDAFGESALIAYRLAARTALWTLGYNRPLGIRDSIDFSWRRIHSTPTAQPTLSAGAGYGAGTVIGPTASDPYTADQFAVNYLLRF